MTKIDWVRLICNIVCIILHKNAWTVYVSKRINGDHYQQVICNAKLYWQVVVLLVFDMENESLETAWHANEHQNTATKASTYSLLKALNVHVSHIHLTKLIPSNRGFNVLKPHTLCLTFTIVLFYKNVVFFSPDCKSHLKMFFLFIECCFSKQ